MFYFKLSFVPYTRCCTLHTMLLFSVSVVPYTQFVSYTHCCTLHYVLKFTLNVVHYTQCWTFHTMLHLTLSVYLTIPGYFNFICSDAIYCSVSLALRLMPMATSHPKLSAANRDQLYTNLFNISVCQQNKTYIRSLSNRKTRLRI